MLPAALPKRSRPGAEQSRHLTFDISEGSITVQSSPHHQGRFEVLYGASQSLDDIGPSQQITIIGSSTTNTVEVSVKGTANITLKDVNITSSSTSPFSIRPGAVVNLTADAANTLNDSSGSNAGLEVPFGQLFEITGASTGSLTAIGGSNGSAGIGGAGSGGSAGSGGTVTINGGSVKASGGENGAGVVGSGIGGGGSAAGNSGSGSTVTINGGSIAATGGSGIGGGSGVVGGSGGTVTINGGSITATGNGPGAGIGGGCGTVGGNGAKVTINGGSVKATGGNGNGGSAIGGGGGSMGGPGSGGKVTINGGSVTANSIQSTVYNNRNTQEYLVTVAGLPSGASASYAVNRGSAVSCATDASGKFYLWLATGIKNIAITASGVQYEASGTVSAGPNNFTVRTSGTFSDVPSSIWCYNAISNLCAKRIVSGYPDGTFQPNSNITRAEFCAMLVNALGLSASETEVSFTDVSPSDWYYSPVSTAVSADLVSGMGNGAFAPNAPITREQMAVMVAKALGNHAPTVAGSELNPFSDSSSVDSWAIKGMEQAIKAGIVNGMNGTLAPLDNATRAQSAAMIYKLLDVLGDNG